MAYGAPFSSPQYLQSVIKEAELAFQSYCDGTVRDNRHKLKLRRLGLDVKNVFFTVRTAKQCKILTKKAVVSPSLEVARPTWINPEHLGLTSCLTLLWARGGWTVDLLCPFQPELPHVSLWVPVLSSQSGSGASCRYESALRKEQNVFPSSLHWDEGFELAKYFISRF